MPALVPRKVSVFHTGRESLLPVAGFNFMAYSSHPTPSSAKMDAFKKAFPGAKELGSSRSAAAAAAGKRTVVPTDSVDNAWDEAGCPTLLAAGLRPDQARLNEESWGPAFQAREAEEGC